MGECAPILVTGSHRSGTTWAGRLLCLSREVEAIHEPFNPTLYHSWLRNPPARWFQFVGRDDTPSPLTADVARVLGFQPGIVQMWRRAEGLRGHGGVLRESLKASRARLHGRRPLLKDPIAFFAAEWLAHRFGARVVVLVRHPAAFAGSLKRLGWSFDFTNLTEQPRLIEGDLAPFRTELAKAARGELDIIDQASLLWRVLGHTTIAYRERHPEWLVLRFEDLASDPVTAYEPLYRALGLTWTPQVERRVRRYTEASNGSEVPDGDRGGVRRDSRGAMWTWASRLAVDEIARVRAATADLAHVFYDDDSWTPPVR